MSSFPTVRTPYETQLGLSAADVERIEMLREVYHKTWEDLGKRYDMHPKTLKRRFQAAKEEE